MLLKITVILSVTSVIITEMVAPGLDRTFSERVTSMSRNVVYGDEDIEVINQVVSDAEKLDTFKKNSDISRLLPPLPATDVKCLMSVDSYCSKDMIEMKSVLIQALKDDCVKCSQTQKEKAGRVVATMMAHDPVAWKQFLTRYDTSGKVQRILGSALQILPEKTPPKEDKHTFKIVGEPEYIENSNHRYTVPGVKVRVKRYAMRRSD